MLHFDIIKIIASYNIRVNHTLRTTCKLYNNNIPKKETIDFRYVTTYGEFNVSKSIDLLRMIFDINSQFKRYCQTVVSLLGDNAGECIVMDETGYYMKGNMERTDEKVLESKKYSSLVIDNELRNKAISSIGVCHSINKKSGRLDKREFFLFPVNYYKYPLHLENSDSVTLHRSAESRGLCLSSRDIKNMLTKSEIQLHNISIFDCDPLELTFCIRINDIKNILLGVVKN